jgi:hypothetical protein
LEALAWAKRPSYSDLEKCAKWGATGNYKAGLDSFALAPGPSVCAEGHHVLTQFHALFSVAVT